MMMRKGTNVHDIYHGPFLTDQLRPVGRLSGVAFPGLGRGVGEGRIWSPLSLEIFRQHIAAERMTQSIHVDNHKWTVVSWSRSRKDLDDCNSQFNIIWCHQLIGNDAGRNKDYTVRRIMGLESISVKPPGVRRSNSFYCRSGRQWPSTPIENGQMNMAARTSR